jgi:hypothetical protein
MAKFMKDTYPPAQSVKSLVLASSLAVLLAFIVLITAVLPVEYGIDPTGFGEVMGLSALSGSSKGRPVVASCKDQLAEWSDSVTLVVPGHSGLEYKFHLLKGAKLDYAWKTEGADVYFDLHGEPKGDKSGYFKSFKISTENQSAGTLTAEFEGPHGWYWENKSQSPITIILNTQGDYRILGLM